MRITKVILIASFLAFASQVEAQVTFDATAHAECGGGVDCDAGAHQVLTVPLTVGVGTNRQLAAFALIGCGSGQTAPTATATYNGTSLTQIQTIAVGPAARRAYMWAWPTGSQPTSGLHNAVVTLSSDIQTTCDGLATLGVGVISVAGVDQATTFTSSNNSSGTGTAVTLTLASSGANDLGVDAACQGTGFTSTTETSRWSVNSGLNSCGSSAGATAAGGDTSLSWTGSGSDSWLMVGGAFKADAGGGGSPANKTLLLLGVGF
jgi:hypothetical protein